MQRFTGIGWRGSVLFVAVLTSGIGAAGAPREWRDYAGGPDDALGLYLRQMGAIPLLTRDKEKSLAQRLEHHRNRFRATALLCPRILVRVLEKFEQISGYTKRSVEAKILRGVWIEGREYVRAPDGRVLVDVDGYQKWARRLRPGV